MTGKHRLDLRVLKNYIYWIGKEWVLILNSPASIPARIRGPAHSLMPELASDSVPGMSFGRVYHVGWITTVRELLAILDPAKHVTVNTNHCTRITASFR